MRCHDGLPFPPKGHMMPFMREKARTICSIINKVCIIVAAYIGIWELRPLAMKPFLYFTNQSNLWMLLIMMVFLYYEIRGKRFTIPYVLLVLKYMCTVAITVTGLVFCFVLMPQRIRSGDTAFIFHYANILVHILVPILSLVDWCFFDPLFLMPKNLPFTGLLLPFSYLLFVAVCVLKHIRFTGRIVPYFFLDYQVLGPWRVLVSVVLLGCGIFFLGCFLIFFKQPRVKDQIVS